MILWIKIQKGDSYMLPKDPIMLLSTVNMKLRDHHDTLEDFCLAHNINDEDIKTTLASVNYYYDENANQFK